MSQRASNTIVSSSYSYSSSGSDSGTQHSGHRAVQQSHTGPQGTIVTSSSQKLGEPVVHSTKQYDQQGRELVDNTNGTGVQRRIEDVSEEQAVRDKMYEERMEDEYAKREGGA